MYAIAAPLPFARRMRELGYRGLIVGLTGDTGEEDVRHFMAHGANAVLPKPFNIDELDQIGTSMRSSEVVGGRDSRCVHGSYTVRTRPQSQ